MSVEHLDILHKQLPELFASKELPVDWGDDLIIVSVSDVELITKAEPVGVPAEPEALSEDAEGQMLDNLGPEYIDLHAEPPGRSRKSHEFSAVLIAALQCPMKTAAKCHHLTA